MVEFINVADLINPETGNTYRQDNLEKIHKIPLGTLVEICHDPENPHPQDGFRLHVVGQNRDCDGTPLYSLGLWDWEEGESGFAVIIRMENGPLWPPHIRNSFHGYSEECLKPLFSNLSVNEK